MWTFDALNISLLLYAGFKLMGFRSKKSRPFQFAFAMNRKRTKVTVFIPNILGCHLNLVLQYSNIEINQRCKKSKIFHVLIT